MVKSLHDAGLEVVLDVVYNHTAEGNQLGPTLSFRGIDNASYYRLAADQRYYEDITGCGNTLDLRHPRVLQMVIDSLRYWVEEMHVDGFRFDLATALAREDDGYERDAAFLKAIAQDPVLSRVQADRGAVGRRRRAAIRSAASRRAGRSGTARYRDTRAPLLARATADCCPSSLRASPARATCSRRRPPAAREHQLRHGARRLHAATISSRTTRSTTRPTAKTTATAPTTTRSWNCGVEGPDRPIRRSSRCASGRSATSVATLFLSLGVPMLLAGDEFGAHAARQQQRLLPGQRDLVDRLERPQPARPGAFEFVKRCCACGASIRPFSATRFSPAGRPRRAARKDIAWLRRPAGR